MIIKIKFRSIFREIDAKKLSYFGNFIGLMFKTKKSKILLFDFLYDSDAAIHSFFVFFDFLAVWLNKQNEVVDVKKVNPFTTIIRPKIKCRKLIEIPFNEDNKEIIDFFVGKRKI